MGTPFFRNVSIYLDYVDDAITVASKTVDSPIHVGGNGDWTDGKKMEIGLTSLSTGQYQGAVYVGTPTQGGSTYAAYSTDSYYSIIP